MKKSRLISYSLRYEDNISQSVSLPFSSVRKVPDDANDLLILSQQRGVDFIYNGELKHDCK